jgi:hypothetical protein
MPLEPRRPPHLETGGDIEVRSCGLIHRRDILEGGRPRECPAELSALGLLSVWGARNNGMKKKRRECADELQEWFERRLGNRGRSAGTLPLITDGRVLSRRASPHSGESHYFGPQMQERAEIEALPRLLSGVRTFVDVGAAFGQYTHFANRAMRGGHLGYRGRLLPSRTSRPIIRKSGRRIGEQ